MIDICIGGITVGIENRFPLLAALCRDYAAADSERDFSVCVSDKDLEEEREMADGEYSDAYIESIAAYRKIAERIPDYDAFVFHGAVIAHEGRAYAVTARSGVGKTTHLRLWLQAFGDKVHILNGDKPILRVINGTVYAAGTPWRGKENYGINEMLPLHGIAFLERSEENFAKAVSPSDALVPLISQIYLPRSPRGASLVLSVANKVISTVPLYRLGVNMDIKAAHVAFEAFTGKKFG